MKNLLVISTAATAITISCPSANAKMFRMTCTPTASAPYTVAYDSDAGVSYITSQSGVTRKYHVLDVKDKSDVHVLYVATKAPNQTRMVYLAFDYSGDEDDVSAIRVIDRASDKRDKCAFIAAPQQGPQSDQEHQQESPAESTPPVSSENQLKIEQEKTKQAQADAKKKEEERKITEAEQKRRESELKAEGEKEKREAEKRDQQFELQTNREHEEARNRAQQLEIQKMREQHELEFQNTVHTLLAIVIPVFGCVLLGVIFITAIKRRAREKAKFTRGQRMMDERGPTWLALPELLLTTILNFRKILTPDFFALSEAIWEVVGTVCLSLFVGLLFVSGLFVSVEINSLRLGFGTVALAVSLSFSMQSIGGFFVCLMSLF